MDTNNIKKQCTDTGMVLTLIAIMAGLYKNTYTFQFLSMGILIINMIVPQVFYPFAILWFALSKLLGNVTSKLLLGIVFFFIVTPVGLVWRILGKDLLRLRDFNKRRSTVFIERYHKFKANDLQHTF